MWSFFVIHQKDVSVEITGQAKTPHQGWAKSAWRDSKGTSSLQRIKLEKKNFHGSNINNIWLFFHANLKIKGLEQIWTTLSASEKHYKQTVPQWDMTSSLGKNFQRSRLVNFIIFSMLPKIKTSGTHQNSQWRLIKNLIVKAVQSDRTWIFIHMISYLISQPVHHLYVKNGDWVNSPIWTACCKAQAGLHLSHLSQNVYTIWADRTSFLMSSHLG